MTHGSLHVGLCTSTLAEELYAFHNHVVRGTSTAIVSAHAYIGTWDCGTFTTSFGESLTTGIV